MRPCGASSGPTSTRRAQAAGPSCEGFGVKTDPAAYGVAPSTGRRLVDKALAGRARPELHRQTGRQGSVTNGHENEAAANRPAKVKVYRSREESMNITRRTFRSGSALPRARCSPCRMWCLRSSVIRVGLIPSEDSRAMLASSSNCWTLWRRTSASRSRASSPPTTTASSRRCAPNHVDIAYLGPFSYVLGTTVAHDRSLCDRRDREVRPHLLSQPDHHPEIQRHQDVDDLKGKTFAFVDPSSTSGHLFPKAGLIKAGIEPGQILRPRDLHRLA